MNDLFVVDDDVEAQALVTFKTQLRLIMEDHRVNWKDALSLAVRAAGLSTTDKDLEQFLWNEGLSKEKNAEIRSKFLE